MEILDRIDWASVNWLYVAVLTALAFFSTLIGALLSFKRTFRTAVLSALLFAAGFVFWTYYPHGLPLPTSITAEKAPDSLPPQRTTLSAPMRSRRPNGVFVLLSSRYGLHRLIKRRRRDAKLINLARRTHRRLCKETRRLPRVL